MTGARGSARPGDPSQGRVPLPAAGVPGSVRVDVAGGGTAAEPGPTRVVLAGEVDAELAAELLAVVDTAAARGAPVEVDVAAVTFMDSTGVAFLARLASRTPTPLTLLRPPEVVRFLIDVTAVGELMTIVDGADRAG